MGGRFLHNSGASRRENAKVYLNFSNVIASDKRERLREGATRGSNPYFLVASGIASPSACNDDAQRPVVLAV
jgi:hypothetical protein